MKAFFENLLEYNRRSNAQLIEAFQANSELSSPSVRLMCHIVNAHRLWNNKIVSEKSVFGAWENHSIEVLDGLDQENYLSSIKILEYHDLNQKIHYSISSGKSFEHPVKDLLYHVINHSTYHRGQIAKELRIAGLQPVQTDYILMKIKE